MQQKYNDLQHVVMIGSKQGSFSARWCMQFAAGYWPVRLRACHEPHLSTTHSTCVSRPSSKSSFCWRNSRHHFAVHLSASVYTSGEHSFVICNAVLCNCVKLFTLVCVWLVLYKLFLLTYLHCVSKIAHVVFTHNFDIFMLTTSFWQTYTAGNLKKDDLQLIQLTRLM